MFQDLPTGSRFLGTVAVHFVLVERMHPPCVVDNAVPARSHVSSYTSSILRRDRQKLGLSISRNRLISKYNNVRPPGCSIVPTRIEGSTRFAVTDVHFLNNDTILSAQSQGQIAVHRLPVGNGPCSGKAHKILDLPPLQEQTTAVKLSPLSDGTSFAMGLPNGDFRIYSGEGATGRLGILLLRVRQ